MAYVEETEELWQLLDRVIKEEGLFLYDLERMGSGGLQSTGLRVTIDAQPPEESHLADSEVPKERVTSGDCSRICRRLMVQLAVEGEEHGLQREPVIEVSSPGVNRTLRRAEHFRGAVGERIKVVPHSGSDGGVEERGKRKKSQNTVTGVLKSFEDDALRVVDERTNEEVILARDVVRRASVDFKF